MPKITGWTKRSDFLWTNDHNPNIRIGIYKQTRGPYPWKISLPNGKVTGCKTYERAYKIAINFMKRNSIKVHAPGYVKRPKQRKLRKQAPLRSLYNIE